MKTIVLATQNPNKLKEFREILTNYNIITLQDIGFTDEIAETGKDFEENATIKAQTVQDFLQKQGKKYIVVAEDSGLCVDSLDGAPGLYSARYAGGHGNNQANRDKLRKDLIGKDRTAYFICTIVVLYPDGEKKVFVGKTYGQIIDEERGDNGFCYDVIFLSDDLGVTFAEATEAEKNQVSHRGRAIRAMLAGLK